MGYLAYIFSLFYDIANIVKIPIPISESLIIHLSIFNILIGCIVLGIIVWFVCKLLNFESNYAFHLLGREQDNVLYQTDNIEFKQTPKDISFRTRSGDYLNKRRSGDTRRKGDATRSSLYN